MLTNLSIQNFILIAELDINFHKGLTVVTGETGAGKSILLGALNLILGERADPRVLLDDSKKCVLEATFDIQHYDLKSWFEENDIDFVGPLLVRREIAVSGRSRAFINDTPVSLKQLRELCSNLVDLHQQFDSLDIHTPAFHMILLDALAENGAALNAYQSDFSSFQKKIRTLNKLKEQEIEAAKEADYIQFNLNELVEAKLEPNEQEELEKELKWLDSAKDVIQVLGSIQYGLTEDQQSVVSSLQEMYSKLLPLGSLSTQIETLQTRFQSVLVELEDIANEFQQLAENTEFDAARILEVQERLDALYRLQNKHRVNNNQELIEILETLQLKATGVQSLGDEIAALENELLHTKKHLLAQAKKISEKRCQVAPTYIEKVENMLAELGMPKAKLKFQHEPIELDKFGIDSIEFLFSANGNRFESIKNAASGGEISRLALCMKSLVAAAIPLPTMIFDEIDSGISGTVSLKLGQILHRLAQEHQIIMITHSPQVAAQGHCHLFVYKYEETDKVFSQVRQLSQNERIIEIATMLSSSPPSESALQNARELLKI